jgi:phosphoribosylformylglycinamidine cyclo-ligase
MTDKGPITYRDAGVDIEAATAALSRAKDHIRATFTPGCLSNVGSFGGLFELPVGDWRRPVLVSSTDGVGTKVKVAAAAGRHDTVGQDLVNHCVNDILVQGARPLFFLDYLGTDRVDGEVFEALVRGLSIACRENGCALIGGETAEMPGVYARGEYDLVGTIIGIVERDRILDGSRVRPGDRILGLPSTGLHTNGYSLARKILFEREGLAADTRLDELGGTVGDALLAVHRSYLGDLGPLLDADLVHAMAHITGGGLVDNVPRVLPEGCAARIERGVLPVPPIFRLLAERGPVPVKECDRAFNMGVGMVVIVAADDEAAALERLPDAARIGEVVAGDRAVELI